MKKTCPLCDAIQGKNITTKVYYSDSNWLLLDCRSCHIPMLIYKPHVPYIHIALEDIEKIFVEVFPNIDHDKRFVDCNMRALPDHFHCHYRIK